MDFDANLLRFKAFLLRRGLKRITIYRHICQIKKLYLEVNPFDAANLEIYLLGLLEKNLSGSYTNNVLGTAKLWERCILQDDSIAKIKDFPEKKPIKEIMSDEEIETFLNLPPKEIKSTRHGIPVTYTYKSSGYGRWTKFFKICAYTGARMGEIANLTINDVNWGINALIIRETKTGEPRRIPIAELIIDDLKELIEAAKDGFLFWSPQGGTTGKEKGLNPVFSNVEWHYNFHERLKRMGIKRKGLTPYSFRHSFITRLLEEDVNLFKVQKIVGHRRVDTTAQYTHMTLKDTQRAIRKHPLIRKHSDPHLILENIKDYLQTMGLENNPAITYQLSTSERNLQFSVALN